jgi:hypothetical protein
MATGQVHQVIERLRWVSLGDEAGQTDGQLLDAFIRRYRLRRRRL